MTPCQTPCEHFDGETHEPEEGQGDTNDLMQSIIDATHHVIDDSTIEQELANVVGEEQAEEIVNEIVKPVIETDIANNDEFVEEVIPHLQEPEAPEFDEVVEAIEEEIIPEADDVEVEAPRAEVVITPEDQANAQHITVENEDGDPVQVAVIEHKHEEEEEQEVVEVE